MEANRIGFPSLVLRTVVVHSLTYFVVGVLALVVFRYHDLFSGSSLSGYMRSTDDALVVAGPLFQPIRGALFASAFYLLREPFFGSRRGWLAMWWTLMVLGILSTFGPAPGSVEGMIYTRVPIADQLAGFPEGVVQSLLMAVTLWFWVRHPEKRWFGRVLSVLFAIVMLLSILGLAARHATPS